MNRHPDAPKPTSIFSWVFSWVKGFWDWIRSWVWPEPKSAQSPAPVKEGVDHATVPDLLNMPLKNEIFLTAESISKLVEEFKGPCKQGQIKFYKRFAKHIGTDTKYQYGKTMSLLDDSPLKVAPKDVYCDIQMNDEPIESTFIELPSSLFSQARVGNTIYYKHHPEEKEEQLFVLSLDKNFDKDLKDAEIEARDSFAVFRYDKDVPEDSIEWRLGVPNIYLSSSTLQIQVGKQGASLLDIDQLHKLPAHSPVKILGAHYTKKLYCLWLSACGEPNITILLDTRRLMVHIDYSVTKIQQKLNPRAETYNNILPLHEFAMFLIPYKEGKFDPQKISASLDNRGILTIKIPSLKGL
jgi:hypothetical protein